MIHMIWIGYQIVSDKKYCFNANKIPPIHSHSFGSVSPARIFAWLTHDELLNRPVSILFDLITLLSIEKYLFENRWLTWFMTQE